MDDFETLLRTYRIAIERFVRFRISSKEDADDLIQEICFSAYQHFGQLRDISAFKPWILQIARNHCNDYFRRKAHLEEISIEEIPEAALPVSKSGQSQESAVLDTLACLSQRDQQILSLYFWEELPQAEIAAKLNIPLGTVKSRLHTAKQNFRKQYPYRPHSIGGNTMTKTLPDYIPHYTITPSDTAPFPVKWEELMGCFLVPQLGEHISWAMYDAPSGKKDWLYDLKVLGEAEVHGIRGVEIEAVPKGTDPTGCSNPSDGVSPARFIAQLTDTHCRYLACTALQNGVKRYITFLDGDPFLENWGFGENNIGNETDLAPKGDIHRNGSEITSVDKEFLLDIVGRYTVTIGGKAYDTVCVMDIETYNGGVVSEQFLDKNGRTILWRRFNRDDRDMERHNRKWSELLPENERITVNGQIYVHWYDCITDYILK